MFDGDWLLAIAAYNCGRRLRRPRIKRKPLAVWALPTDLLETCNCAGNQ